MTLQFVNAEAASPPLKVLLYGQPGAGKSCGAASAPGPILYCNSEGPDALSYSRKLYGGAKIHEVAFAGKQTLSDVYLHLKGKHDEKTVVIDSIGEVYRMLLEEIGGDRPTIQNYGDVNTLIERFVRSLRDLPEHLVLVAHEDIADVEGELVRRPFTGGKRLPEMLMAMMSQVAYCGVVPATDDTPRRYIGQLIQARGRRAKDRSGVLGESRELDLTEWIETIRSAAATTEVAA